MSHRHLIYRLLSIFTVLSMLLSPLIPLASEALASAPSDAPAVAPPTTSGVLFRTTVTLRQPTDRARLDKLGVTVLETTTTNGEETALVVVTADRLETLARLGFAPRNTDSVIDLVASQPLAAQSLQPLADEARSAAAIIRAIPTGFTPSPPGKPETSARARSNSVGMTGWARAARWRSARVMLRPACWTWAHWG